MATSFRRPTQIVRRSMGYYDRVSGEYVKAVEPPSVSIMAAIYPATALDYDRTISELGGRRSGQLKRMVSDTFLNVATALGKGHPGDIVIHQNERWLVISRADNTVLGTSVSHYRYLLARGIEHAEGESPL